MPLACMVLLTAFMTALMTVSALLFLSKPLRAAVIAALSSFSRAAIPVLLLPEVSDVSLVLEAEVLEVEALVPVLVAEAIRICCSCSCCRRCVVALVTLLRLDILTPPCSGVPVGRVCHAGRGRLVLRLKETSEEVEESPIRESPAGLLCRPWC